MSNDEARDFFCEWGRQRALTLRLGQVWCSAPWHNLDVVLGFACSDCGAAL